MSFRVPEKFRIRTGPLASTAAIGNAGAFDIRLPHSQSCSASHRTGMDGSMSACRAPIAARPGKK